MAGRQRRCKGRAGRASSTASTASSPAYLVLLKVLLRYFGLLQLLLLLLNLLLCLDVDKSERVSGYAWHRHRMQCLPLLPQLPMLTVTLTAAAARRVTEQQGQGWPASTHQLYGCLQLLLLLKVLVLLTLLSITRSVQTLSLRPQASQSGGRPANHASPPSALDTRFQ